MAHYSTPYEPAFRLVTTEPMSGTVVKVGDVEVPTEFICNLFVVAYCAKGVTMNDSQINRCTQCGAWIVHCQVCHYCKVGQKA